MCETPAENARLRETPQAQAEGGPPAESECLKRKSTSKSYKPSKKLEAKSIITGFVYSLKLLIMIFSRVSI
jgi:hypothetical protein